MQLRKASITDQLGAPPQGNTGGSGDVNMRDEGDPGSGSGQGQVGIARAPLRSES